MTAHSTRQLRRTREEPRATTHRFIGFVSQTLWWWRVHRGGRGGSTGEGGVGPQGREGWVHRGKGGPQSQGWIPTVPQARLTLWRPESLSHLLVRLLLVNFQCFQNFQSGQQRISKANVNGASRVCHDKNTLLVLSLPVPLPSGPAITPIRRVIAVWGCPDGARPAGGWLRRRPGALRAETGCSAGPRGTWTLVCNGTHWRGPRPNCSDPGTNQSTPGAGGGWGRGWWVQGAGGVDGVRWMG